jgi:histidinol-phosphatase (PHP family)
MRIDQLEGYLRTVRKLAARYADQINIAVGLECEYFPDYLSWLEDRLRDERAESRADYAILGHHFDLDEINGAYFGANTSMELARRYARQVIEGMETGLYACVAHPDLFVQRFDAFTSGLAELSREICRASRALSVPLEYNLYGLRKQAQPVKPIGLGYPNARFWEIAAEEGCAAIIGVDAHEPQHLGDPELGMLAKVYLDRLGLRVIDTLEGVAACARSD